MTLQKLFIVVRGILYAALFILFWVWLAISVQPIDKWLSFSIPLWLRLIGLVIGLLGATIAIWCIGAFILHGQGTPAPFDPPAKFVAIGPYRYVRNPMYIGGILVILGSGLVLASPSIIVLSIFFFLCAHLFVIFYEEPTLAKRFGNSYKLYKTSVNRWRPAIPPKIS